MPLTTITQFKCNLAFNIRLNEYMRCCKADITHSCLEEQYKITYFIVVCISSCHSRSEIIIVDVFTHIIVNVSVSMSLTHNIVDDSVSMILTSFSASTTNRKSPVTLLTKLPRHFNPLIHTGIRSDVAKATTVLATSLFKPMSPILSAAASSVVAREVARD